MHGEDLLLCGDGNTRAVESATWLWHCPPHLPLLPYHTVVEVVKDGYDAKGFI